MNWLDKLERKYPRFGIPNITMYLVACNAVGFLLGNISAVSDKLSFDMADILSGQIWRLITWIFAPSGGSYFTTIIFLLCALSWGKSLEQMIGTFRTTVFVIGGVIINLVGAILFYFISALLLRMMGYTTSLSLLGAQIGLSAPISVYYIILTILMEIALMYPDGVVRFWFILPMKMKWMFWITLAELVYEVARIFYIICSAYGWNGPMILTCINYSLPVIFALLNLLVFYLASKNRVSHKQKKRQREFHQQFTQASPRPGSGITKHKCAICGKTEVSNPELLFRYCSKCPSGLEYCSDHLFTHTHK